MIYKLANIWINNFSPHLLNLNYADSRRRKLIISTRLQHLSRFKFHTPDVDNEIHRTWFDRGVNNEN